MNKDEKLMSKLQKRRNNDMPRDAKRLADFRSAIAKNTHICGNRCFGIGDHDIDKHFFYVICDFQEIHEDIFIVFWGASL